MTEKANGIYMLAHGFSEQTEMDRHVKYVIEICGKHNIQGEPSKMGTHLTLLPPFYANEESIRFASSVLKVVTAFIGKMQVTVLGVGIFPPPNPNTKTEALHLKIELPGKYHEHVEWLKINSSFPWVHPPMQTTAVEPKYIPHVHVIEGENLKDALSSYYKEIEFVVSGKSFQLLPPQFFRKNPATKQWQQVT